MARTQRPSIDQTQAIGGRLISTLRDDFGLNMTEAAKALGYANATTLHKVRSGLALPDPERLARFAKQQRLILGQTLNLHWVLTGQGTALIRQPPTRPISTQQVDSIDVDLINALADLEPEVKQILVVLMRSRAA